MAMTILTSFNHLEEAFHAVVALRRAGFASKALTVMSGEPLPDIVEHAVVELHRDGFASAAVAVESEQVVAELFCFRRTEFANASSPGAVFAHDHEPPVWL